MITQTVCCEQPLLFQIVSMAHTQFESTVLDFSLGLITSYNYTIVRVSICTYLSPSKTKTNSELPLLWVFIKKEAPNADLNFSQPLKYTASSIVFSRIVLSHNN